MANRKSVIKRETKETNINLELDIDGSGNYEMVTGIMMFDHLLSQLAKHGIFDIKISAIGDDQHHLPGSDPHDARSRQGGQICRPERRHHLGDREEVQGEQGGDH